MIAGMRYVVTRASAHGEFEVGDRVQLLDDGSLLNLAAQGWMPVEDVAAATDGWTIEPDAEWAAARRAELQSELSALAP